MSRRVPAALLALSLAVSIAGCTKVEDPAPDDPTTAVGTEQPTTPTVEPTPELTDRSDLVLEFTTNREPIATTTGVWNSHNSFPVTLSIYALEATETTTRLVYGLTRQDGRVLIDFEARNWALFPVLVDTDAGLEYLVNTYEQPGEANRIGAYTILSGSQQGFAPATAQFPPLPADVTSVDISMPRFDTIEDVPVTRP